SMLSNRANRRLAAVYQRVCIDSHDAVDRPVIRSFYCAVRPPQRSTLFPYTTLFRSNVDLQRASAERAADVGGAEADVYPACRAQGRESTRLKSSDRTLPYCDIYVERDVGAGSERVVAGEH